MEDSHVDGPGEAIEVHERVIVASESVSSHSVNTDMKMQESKEAKKATATAFPTKE